MAKNGEIKGLDKLLKDLTNLGVEGVKAISEVTHITGEFIEAEAKKNASHNIDTGKLAQDIEAINISNLQTKIYANASGKTPYAAYVEFGTGLKASVPAELSEMAAKFKGKKGGSFDDGLERIRAWCKRKGIPEEAAYPIFMSLLKNGMEAKPFLYPAYLKGKKQYIQDLKHELKQLTKKI